MIVILAIPYAIMMIIIDIVTSNQAKLSIKEPVLKKQKEAEKKEEKQKVENIDLDL